MEERIMAHRSRDLISRRQFMRLAGTTALGTVAAACGAPVPTPASTEPAPTAAAAAAPTVVAATAPTAAAAATAPAVVTAPVKLIYKFPGTTQKDIGEVQDALSALLQEKIGATIELQLIDWGA